MTDTLFILLGFIFSLTAIIVFGVILLKNAYTYAWCFVTGSNRPKTSTLYLPLLAVVANGFNVFMYLR